LLQTQRELALFLIVIVVLVVLSGTVVFFLESNEHDTDFVSIPASLWWAMMTVTTIGYGDMVPQTKEGKVAVRACTRHTNHDVAFASNAVCGGRVQRWARPRSCACVSMCAQCCSLSDVFSGCVRAYSAP